MAGLLLGVSVGQVLRDLGYVGVVLLMAVETIFPPIPSEAVLPLAGYLAERGDLDLVGVFVSSTIGSVAGAMLLYELARRGGRPFARKFVRRARLPESRLEDADRAFARRGPLYVVLGRCLPGIRSLVSIPAGVLRMRRSVYLGCTVLGSALWNAVLIGAGYGLGARWEQITHALGPVSAPLIAVVVLAALWLGARWWRRERRRAESC